jgi:hypothetical protein
MGIVALVLVAVEGFQFYQTKTLKDRIIALEWTSGYQDKDAADSTIEPTVGIIQFLKRGYSIEVETAKYTGDGLYLKGFVGNPSFLTLTNLTINFDVYKPLYRYREDFIKNGGGSFWFYLNFNPIGKAQTSPIPRLSPGGREEFEVTIPNVKQTSDGIRMEVRFSGERYNL